MTEGIQVSLEHVLGATQARLVEQTERSIMLEALCNQQGVEIDELKQALQTKEEVLNGTEG